MQVEQVRKTGGQVDELTMALIDAANDKQIEVRQMIVTSLHEIGKKQFELVLSMIKAYLIKHQKLNVGHRVVLLKAVSQIIKDTLAAMPIDMAKQMVKLASAEMTRNKEVVPEWQTAASEVLVALGGRFDHEVMAELLEKLAPGSLPHYFVVQTLASFSSTNAFGVVPFLKDILGRMLPMLGMAKHDNMKWVFANCLARFSESILDYVANIEAAPYPDITLDRFYGEIFSAYDVLFNVWLKSNEPKIRLTVVSAVGHMSHIMSPDKLGEQLSKILAGITGLYKRHTEHYQITQALCMVLDAACAGGGHLLSQHLDTLLNGLHGMVCNMPDFSNPVSFKNHNEILRCFSVITPSFSDRVIGFLLMKMEANNERTRLGSLAVIKHLINSSGSHLENKEGLIVNGVQILLTEQNLKVRSMFAQAITAMAHHRYLELDGGQNLVEFIVRQCAMNDDGERRDARRQMEPDAVSPRALRSMCENILHLVTTTVDVMELVLWPSLLQCVVPEAFTNAMAPLCRSLSDIASKKREEEAEDFMIDFETKTNIPKPVALISRLVVMAGHPAKGRGRGAHVLKLLKALCPILKAELVEMWDTVIPKLQQYLEGNIDGDTPWNQKAWEDLLLKLLSKSLDEGDSEEWVMSLGSEMGAQIQLYHNLPEEKNFLFKCMGIVLRKSTNKNLIQGLLNAMFGAVKHSSQVEREGCAIGFGFCAGTNLDDALNKLEMVSKNEMVRKSTGLLGFMKDKSESDAEKIKSTVMLCYGYSVLYASPSQVTSRLDTSVMRVIGKHFTNVKDLAVKHSLIRTTELIGKALEPSRLQEPGYIFSKRGQLVTHMLTYMKSEPTATITTETRALAMDACASLAKLNPVYNDAEVFDIVKTSTDSVFPLPAEKALAGIKKDDEQEKDPEALLKQSLESLSNLLKAILLRAPFPSALQAICKHLENSWLISVKDEERERAMETILVLLQVFKANLQTSSNGGGGFPYAGQLLARLIPRCTDPVICIRQLAIEAVQILLRISASFEGYSLDSKDEHLDALSTLKTRAAESDPNILFSVASDLSKVVAKKLQNVHLAELTATLLEGLTDGQSHSASGSCVVLNSMVRIRGQELRREVDTLVRGMHQKLCYVSHQQTRTGTLRVFRTIASHHLVPLLTAILQFPMPFDDHVVEIWKTLAGEASLALNVFNYLLDLLTRTAPYQEKPNPKKKKETVRVATFQPTAICCGLTEMFRVETCTELAVQHFSRLFSSALLRLGVSVTLLPPEDPSEAAKDSKAKSKGPRVDPRSAAVECMKQLLVRCQYDKMEELLNKEDGWSLFADQKTYPEGIALMARALCATAPQQIPKLADHMNPCMSSAYDDNRIVVAAFFAELIDQRCGGHREIVEVLMNSLLGRLVDSSLVVRKFCIRGLGNMSSVEGSQIERYSTTVLSAMMAGMDDRDDVEDEITLESMSGLAKILAKLDENNVRQILINICLRIRPCFEKEKDAVRAAAFTLFGKLSRFGDGPSRAPFLEQVHTNFISVLLHLNEEPEVARACKSCLRSVGPLMGSESVDEVFQKHLLEEGHLHYGEFVNALSRLIIADFSEKISFYVMGCVSFFKSSRADIKANAALFVGFLLGNLPKEKRDDISKDHVCGALILLLRDPSTEVRSRAAEAMSLLFDY